MAHTTRRSIGPLIVGLAVSALVASGCTWHFETLDGEGGKSGSIPGDVGEYSSVVIYNGQPHAFYYDRDGGELRHAYWNGSFWVFEILDGPRGLPGQVNHDVGAHTTSLIYNGKPHVFYYDLTTDDLRHAYYNGVAWAFETLDGDGGAGGRTLNAVGEHAAAMLYNGRPHVFYYDATDHSLRHGYWNGLTWAFETLDGNGGPDGRIVADLGLYNDAILYNNRPHVFYENQFDATLRHAYYNGVAWAFETLDGAGGPNGRIVANLGRHNTAILYNGRPHVFYENWAYGDLRHGYWNGVFWAFETLDGAGGPNGRVNDMVGSHASAIVHGTLPHVFYRDSGAGDLRHAAYNGSHWTFEPLDGEGAVGGGADDASVGTHNAAFVYNGRLRDLYFNETDKSLRHAWLG